MCQLITLFRGCLLTSLTAIHLNVYSYSTDKNTSSAQNEVFQLPAWVVKESVVDQLSWQGLAMKIELFKSPKTTEDFLSEIASLVPAGSVMTKTAEGYQVSWVTQRFSYVLLVEDNLSSEMTYARGVLSSIEMTSRVEADFALPKNCSTLWLPDDAQLIFSMGDKSGVTNQARIEGYSSELDFSEARAVILNRLKQYGWVSLAEYPRRSELARATTFEAYCGNRHARIDLQKKPIQTRIAVMSIVQ